MRLTRAGDGVERWGGTVDDVRRVEVVEREIVDLAFGKASRERRRIGDEVVDLVGEQHEDLTGVGEVPAFGHAPAELVEAHPHLVMAADVARLDPLTGGPHTYHTTNPVPFILVTENNKLRLKSGGALRDIAPTLLGVLGQQRPAEMSGTDLRIVAE